MKQFLGIVSGLLLCFSITAGQAQTQAEGVDGRKYKTGFAANVRLGMDIYKALKTKYKEYVHVQPVSLETEIMPYLRSVEETYEGEPKPMRMIFISVGFVDLVNNVAHAKAIDGTTKGYFQKYIVSLSQETGEEEMKELPDLSKAEYWTEDMMNEQLSNFNQMVGMVVAIELSHFYLGHFNKYKDKLKDANGKPVPINSLLTEAEWDESVKMGALNALNAGYGIEGVKALYDAIDKMPQRPAWTSYFLPTTIKVSKVKKSLEKLERDFFAGKTDY